MKNRLPNFDLPRRYQDDLRLIKSWPSLAGWAALAIIFFAAPFYIRTEFWVSVLNNAGIFAIGAIGLNLLTGYTGQVSLGHAFFMGIGAYATVIVGVQHELPLVVWLPAAAVAGGVVGGLVGPFALRLRGNYLAVVSLGLIFLGLHIFENWESVTGGSFGTSVTAEFDVFGFDFADIEALDSQGRRTRGLFWLIWGVVFIGVIVAKNIVRSRPGRAMQAVRDRDVAAEVIGVSLARYKIGAFALSGAYAAVAGALFAANQQFVNPADSWNLQTSIQYIAIIIVGGVGTIFGGVLGALFLGAVPEIVSRYSTSIPFVATRAGEDGLTVFQLNRAIFGLLIVAFLVFEPRGLAAVWLRTKAYFRTWPFSY